MRIIKFLLSHSPRVVILAAAAGLVSGVSNAGLLALINRALNTGGGSGASLALAFIALCLGLMISRATSELSLSRLGQGALFDLRMHLSRQILAVPLRRLEEIGSPRLLAALAEDVPTITNVINVLPVVCINVAVVIACLIYLGLLSWGVLVGVLALMAVGIVSYQLAVARALRYLARAREEGNKLYKHFNALTAGIKELKLHRHRRQSFIEEVLYPTASSYHSSSVKGMTTYTIAGSWGQLLVFIILGLLIFRTPFLDGVDTATITGYTLTVLYMMSPLQVVMNTLPTLGRGEVALSNVEELGLALEKSSTEMSDERDVIGLPSPGVLELVGVSHSYLREGEETRFTLGPLDLSLSAGELLFLVGGNGSGKTTLAKIITGLYVPEAGTISVNGRLVTDETREHYRQMFSAVFSDFYLFESLLGLSAPELDAQARHYLSRLQLAQKVQVSDGVLSTTDLSQGQRKRLALLTAYLEDRPVYLFDEWAADQDRLFKDIFYLQLLPDLKSKGKTVIVITHDDRYYHAADRIIKLEDGKIDSAWRADGVEYASAVLSDSAGHG